MKPFGLLLLGLAAIFSGCDSQLTHGVSFVLGAGTNVAQVTPGQVKSMAQALAGRVDGLGYPSEVGVSGSNHVTVKLPFKAVESMGKRRTLLTKTGLLEFCLVHEESPRLVQEGIVPAGYRLLHETRTRPGGMRDVVPWVVSRRVPGLSGDNISRAAPMRGKMNDVQVAIEFDAAGRETFAQVTGTNVGRQLAVVVDGEVHSAPVIQAAITEGNALISGGSLTYEDAWELATLLQFPFEFPVQVLAEKTF